MKKLISLMLSALLTSSLAACVLGGPTPAAKVQYPPSVGFEDHDAYRAVRESNPVDPVFTASVADFAYRTASELFASNDGNANFSPLSLYYALSLAASGAKGETWDQLAGALGVSSVEELSGQCGNLFRLLYSDNSVKRLYIANSLWLGTDTAFKSDFVLRAASDFYASAYSVDFGDPSTGGAMAKWVLSNTGGTLTPDFETRAEQILAIINTVYYKGEWIDRFDSSATKDDVFHAPTGDVTAAFMNRTNGSASFAAGDGYLRSELHLKGGENMVFILPDEGTTPEELIKSVGVKELFTGGESSYGEVVWKLPKFSFDAEYNLNELLQTLGVTSAFDTDADFSGITDGTAFITDVLQGTHIALDENGVEASAFTAIMYAGAAMPQGRAEMILDRPFIYGIVTWPGIPLFVGIVNDPSA